MIHRFRPHARRSIFESAQKTKQWYRHRFFKSIEPYTGRLWDDGHWRGIDVLRKVIVGAFPECEVETWVENGGYRNYFDGDGKSKQWKLRITTPEGYEFLGTMEAFATGTVEDPFKRYDCTAQIW